MPDTAPFVTPVRSYELGHLDSHPICIKGLQRQSERLQYHPPCREGASRGVRGVRGYRESGTARERGRNVPPSSEFGTHKTVTARSWPWLSGKNHEICQGVASSLGSGTRMGQGGYWGTSSIRNSAPLAPYSRIMPRAQSTPSSPPPTPHPPCPTPKRR